MCTTHSDWTNSPPSLLINISQNSSKGGIEANWLVSLSLLSLSLRSLAHFAEPALSSRLLSHVLGNDDDDHKAKYYQGISSSSLSSSLSSGYSWSFSKATQRELDDASSIRKFIDTGSRPLPGAAPSSSRAVGPTLPSVRGPTLGPSMPPSALSALHQSREASASLSSSMRETSRAESSKARREAREEERDGRATGRERVLEKRREVAGGMREMREQRESGGMVDVPDDVLMGSGGTSDFKAMFVLPFLLAILPSSLTLPSFSPPSLLILPTTAHFLTLPLLPRSSLLRVNGEQGSSPRLALPPRPSRATSRRASSGHER